MFYKGDTIQDSTNNIYHVPYPDPTKECIPIDKFVTKDFHDKKETMIKKKTSINHLKGSL